MAGVCLLVLATCLLLETYGLEAVVVDDQTDRVLLSRQAATAVLRRQRRHNSGHLEEFQKDNLERECLEERCTMEEAREVFENNEKTMEFWASYVDGDQCKPESPCQNGGMCKDGVNAYFCFCQADFSGKNCEIEIAKQCSNNNGGCAHFCVMQRARAMCQCAQGYKLKPDRKSCEATELFACGQVTLPAVAAESASRTLASDPDDPLEYEDYNATAADYDYVSNRSRPLTPGNTAMGPRSSGNAGGEEGGGIPHWAFYPTVGTVTTQDNHDQRIVGGNEATPGEIPWQATLMSLKRTPFCGGSLLSQVWVITAAHCLTELKLSVADYIVRLGEHDVTQDDGHERDHTVAEQILHPHYDERRSRFNHDIALLRLGAPVELSERRRPVCFGPKDFTEQLLLRAKSSRVSGWGRLTNRALTASRLQKLEVPYVDRTLCKSTSRDHITRFMFCAGYEAAPMDTCQGDSGGPHTTDYKGTWFLTGIVSWGEDCAKVGKYGVYTRVSRYYNWIGNVTGIR
ncbi:unnamed protein product [Lota lota]